jgi:hypothetical protein
MLGILGWFRCIVKQGAHALSLSKKPQANITTTSHASLSAYDFFVEYVPGRFKEGVFRPLSMRSLLDVICFDVTFF